MFLWAWEIDRVTLDGVYFRSSKVQHRKNSKTDNSCIVANVNVDERSSSRQRSATVSRNVTCYGIVQTFYLHFMYPPSNEQLLAATTKSKLDPSKINIPWMVLAYCDWYLPKGNGIHPATGLVHITPEADWNESCPLIRMQDCQSVNVAFWPTDPIRKYRNRLTRMFKECPSSDDEDEKQPEHKFAEEDDYLVITHHEQVPVIVRNR